MKLLTQCLAVAGGGALGAVLRFLLGTLCVRLFGAGFPVGTLVINVSGSLVLGWFLTFVQPRETVSDTLRLAVAVGLLGAYTTFSTFAYESNLLLNDGLYGKTLFNMAGSVILSLVAVRLGIMLGR
jgi:CrcB protein